MSVTRTADQNWPVITSRENAIQTAAGSGRNSLLTLPVAVLQYQAARQDRDESELDQSGCKSSAAHDALPFASLGIALRRHGAPDLVAQQRIKLVAQRVEARLEHEIGRARMRCIDLDDGFDLAGPRRHHGNAVGEKYRFGEAMGDEDDCLAGLRQQDRKIFAEHHPRLLVERGERLVHQQNIGADADAARHVHALAHADRKLGRIVPREASHADRFERFERAQVPLAFGDVLEFQRDAEVLEDRVPGKQRAFLKDERDLARLRLAADWPAVNGDVAASRRCKAADNIEKRALAASRRAEQTDEFAATDIKRDIVEGKNRLRRTGVAVTLTHIAD